MREYDAAAAAAAAGASEMGGGDDLLGMVFDGNVSGDDFMAAIRRNPTALLEPGARHSGPDSPPRDCHGDAVDHVGLFCVPWLGVRRTDSGSSGEEVTVPCGGTRRGGLGDDEPLQ